MNTELLDEIRECRNLSGYRYASSALALIGSLLLLSNMMLLGRQMLQVMPAITAITAAVYCRVYYKLGSLIRDLDFAKKDESKGHAVRREESA